MLLLINWRKKVYIIKQKLILHRLNYEDRKVSIFKWDAAIKSVLTGAKATRSLLIRLLVINVWLLRLLLHVYTSLAKYLQLLYEQMSDRAIATAVDVAAAAATVVAVNVESLTF